MSYSEWLNELKKPKTLKRKLTSFKCKICGEKFDDTPYFDVCLQCGNKGLSGNLYKKGG